MRFPGHLQVPYNVQAMSCRMLQHIMITIILVIVQHIHDGRYKESKMAINPLLALPIDW
jgi:hypothetical protein